MSETKVNDNVNNKDVEQDNTVLTPSEYFNKVKDMATTETSEDLQAFYNTAMTKFKKYMITGQKEPARHIYNLCQLAKREIEIINSGIDTFVYREDIDTYINNVADDCVVIIELENYERDIPDDIVDKIMVCKEKNLFDKYYIVFTDYTGEHRSKVEDKKRAKDPIIFGNCLLEGKVSSKMYFIGDWIDEYCDLTLDKMIEEMTKAYKNQPSMKKEVTPILTLEEAEKVLQGDISLIDPSKKIKTTASKKSSTAKARSKKTSSTNKIEPKKRGRKKKNEE